MFRMRQPLCSSPRCPSLTSSPAALEIPWGAGGTCPAAPRYVPGFSQDAPVLAHALLSACWAHLCLFLILTPRAPPQEAPPCPQMTHVFLLPSFLLLETFPSHNDNLHSVLWCVLVFCFPHSSVKLVQGHGRYHSRASRAQGFSLGKLCNSLCLNFLVDKMGKTVMSTAQTYWGDGINKSIWDTLKVAIHHHHLNIPSSQLSTQ